MLWRACWSSVVARSCGREREGKQEAPLEGLARVQRLMLVDESEEPRARNRRKRRGGALRAIFRRGKSGGVVADDLPTGPSPSPELPSYRKSTKMGQECGERGFGGRSCLPAASRERRDGLQPLVVLQSFRPRLLAALIGPQCILSYVQRLEKARRGHAVDSVPPKLLQRVVEVAENHGEIQSAPLSLIRLLAEGCSGQNKGKQRSPSKASKLQFTSIHFNSLQFARFQDFKEIGSRPLASTPTQSCRRQVAPH